MKRLTDLIIIALTLVLLCGCADTGLEAGSRVDGTKMVAEIKSISDVIEVEVIEGEYDTSGIYWVHVSSATIFETDIGDRINLSDLSVGDRIAIIYSGQVMMSYPPQIVAKKIVKLV